MSSYPISKLSIFAFYGEAVWSSLINFKEPTYSVSLQLAGVDSGLAQRGDGTQSRVGLPLEERAISFIGSWIGILVVTFF